MTVIFCDELGWHTIEADWKQLGPPFIDGRPYIEINYQSEQR